MGKGARIRRRRPAGGIPQPDKISTMSGLAVDIAVSEITGIPRERLCGYALIALEHLGGGAHMLQLSCMDNNYRSALPLVENGLADLRQTLAAQ